MKDILLSTLKDYLLLYPEESKRQILLLNYLETHSNEEIIDWNNFDGHVVAGGFIYAKKENKFLVLYHNDLKMFLYPGGHSNKDDKTPLETAKREIAEETGIVKIDLLKISKNELVPLDIDTHTIEFNRRLNLPEHYHFDFRYLFMVEKASEIVIDKKELSNYRWVNIEELTRDKNYGIVVSKIKKILSLK